MASKEQIINDDGIRQKITAESKVSEYADLVEIRLLLVGKTGNGKSATGNTILGWNCFLSRISPKSVTDKGQMGKMRWKGKVFTVVDTPGLFDTSMSKETLQLEIVRCFGAVSPGPHVILFVLSSARFTNEEIQASTQMLDLLTEDPKRHMMLCFTGKDDLEHGEMTEQEFLGEATNDLKQLMKRCNQNILFVNNRLTQPDEILHQWNHIYSSIDGILASNNNAFYTNILFEDIEKKIKEKIAKTGSAHGETYNEQRAKIQWNISLGGEILFFLIQILAVFSVGSLYGSFIAAVLGFNEVIAGIFGIYTGLVAAADYACSIL